MVLPQARCTVPDVSANSNICVLKFQPIKIIRVLQYQPIKTRVKETEKPDSYRRTTPAGLQDTEIAQIWYGRVQYVACSAKHECGIPGTRSVEFLKSEIRRTRASSNKQQARACPCKRKTNQSHKRQKTYPSPLPRILAPSRPFFLHQQVRAFHFSRYARRCRLYWIY